MMPPGVSRLRTRTDGGPSVYGKRGVFGKTSDSDEGRLMGFSGGKLGSVMDVLVSYKREMVRVRFCTNPFPATLPIITFVRHAC